MKNLRQFKLTCSYVPMVMLLRLAILRGTGAPQVRVKNMKPFVSPSFQSGAKTGSLVDFECRQVG